MKHILLPALLFIASIASAQLLQNKTLSALKKDEVFSQLNIKNGKRVVQSRNGNELRLDSVVSFKNYLGLDSLKFQVAAREHLGDTTVNITFHNLNETSGVWENGVRYVLGFDASGRNNHYEFLEPIAGGYQLQFQQDIYFRFTEGDKKDSTYIYYRDPNNGIFFNESRYVNYNYNLNDQETLFDQYSYSSSGTPTVIRRTQSTYDVQNRLDSIKYYFGLDTSFMQLFTVRSYNYAGDDTIIYTETKFTSSWTPSQRVTIVNNDMGDPLSVQYENYNAASQEWIIYQRVFRSYDILNRLTGLTITNYDANGFGFSTFTEYGYINDTQTAYAFVFDIDPFFGDSVLRQKDYFYYSEVSGTNGPQPEIVNVAISPNPATDMFRIDAGKSLIERVEIYNLSGQLIQSSATAGNTVFTFNRGALVSGTYLVKVITNKGTAAREVIFK